MIVFSERKRGAVGVAAWQRAIVTFEIEMLPLQVFESVGAVNVMALLLVVVKDSE